MYLPALLPFLITGAFSASLKAIPEPVLEARAATTTTCTNAKSTPTPTGLVCEVQGSVKRPSVLYNISPLPNIQACWQNCLSNTRCATLGYASSNKTCTLYTTTLAAQGFTSGSTGVVFSNRGCYSCQCTAGLGKCGQNCVDFQTDVNNCGKCGNTCPTGRVCTNGACACPNGNGFFMQLNAPNFFFDGGYIGLRDQSTYTNPMLVGYRTQATTFRFQGTNVTNTFSNLTLVGDTRSAPSNPPSIANRNGTGIHDTAFGAAPIGQFNATAQFLANCSMSMDNPPQLRCSNYKTLNQLQLCDLSAADSNPYDDQYVLALGDDVAYICNATAVNLICA